MKAISGAIVLLAGAIIVAAGFMSGRGDSSVAIVIGGIVMLFGFSAWIAGLRTEK